MKPKKGVINWFCAPEGGEEEDEYEEENEDWELRTKNSEY